MLEIVEIIMNKEFSEEEKKRIEGATRQYKRLRQEIKDDAKRGTHGFFGTDVPSTLEGAEYAYYAADEPIMYGRFIGQISSKIEEIANEKLEKIIYQDSSASVADILSSGITAIKDALTEEIQIIINCLTGEINAVADEKDKKYVIMKARMLSKYAMLIATEKEKEGIEELRRSLDSF